MAKSPRRRAISHEAGTAARLRRGQFDLDQHFIGLKVGRQRAREEIRCRDQTFLFGRPNAETGFQGERDRGKFGGRIGMRKIAADRAAIADLGMGDCAAGLRRSRERAFQRCHRAAAPDTVSELQSGPFPLADEGRRDRLSR